MHPRRLPRDVLDRVERVMECHRVTKLTAESVRAQPTILKTSIKPDLYRRFDDLPGVALPTEIMDAPVPALDLLNEGLGAVPESQYRPPQNLKTLASWLFLANGLVGKPGTAAAVQGLRTCPSSGALYPFEIYVAAFGIEGLEPGLYHYNPKQFSLRKLRDGAITLATIKRGRPDLNFLKGVPALVMVSTIFWRSAWRYRQRGYRMALLDAGHLVQNLVASANGLGIQTMPRFSVNDRTMRELIGIPDNADFGSAENVQAMVVWADDATHPLKEATGMGSRDPLPRIARHTLSSEYVPYGSILATHMDCVAPGMPLRDIRPPMTELTPMPLERLGPAIDYTEPPVGGPSIRHVLLARRSTRAFTDHSISRDKFLALNRLAFRGGSVFPMLPDGPHSALVRPYWINHAVSGVDRGILYFDPASNRMACIREAQLRSESTYLSVEQAFAGQAAAVCFIVADLRTLTGAIGPDAYRLAHLEAGLVGQRLLLAATALGLGSCGIGAFYDDPVKIFLGLEDTGWEPLYAVAVGVRETAKKN